MPSVPSEAVIGTGKKGLKMDPPSSLYAILQAMAIVLIFLAAFLALFLAMIVFLVAAEFSRAGVSFVRATIG